ncbi:hypothetical protein EVAR_20253_1 [Eumeta japonica]|uniref:Uncharacterized protein n=1 Tax=Eumeta variegata TaxID=151549 RepID=A0A4C1W7A9_EUMVA|nr:hypothetical protein EVAR_20253_1 [Eumeta japonica]
MNRVPMAKLVRVRVVRGKRQFTPPTQKHSTTSSWIHQGSSTREAEPLRPPPRLPRHYLELEPRPLTDRDAPLTDYTGECVGRLSDFHVAWRLQQKATIRQCSQAVTHLSIDSPTLINFDDLTGTGVLNVNGFLVDELEETTADAPSMASLRRPSFSELQAAIQAAASTMVPAASSAISMSSDPIASPTTPFLSPILFSPEPPLCETPQPLPSSPPLHIHERKRKLAENKVLENVRIPFKISKQHRQQLLQISEFNVPTKWRDNVVKTRCRLVLQLRRKLRDSFDTTDSNFAGFYDSIHPSDIGCGFRGWCSAEVEVAQTAVEMAQTSVEGVRVESDDDGFFEQSSLGDCDHSSAPYGVSSSPGNANSESWAREVAARAVAAADAGGVDVQAAGARVLATLKPERATSFINVLRNTATTLPEVSHLFLATLFLTASENAVVGSRSLVTKTNSSPRSDSAMYYFYLQMTFDVVAVLLADLQLVDCQCKLTVNKLPEPQQRHLCKAAAAPPEGSFQRKILFTETTTAMTGFFAKIVSKKEGNYDYLQKGERRQGAGGAWLSADARGLQVAVERACAHVFSGARSRRWHMTVDDSVNVAAATPQQCNQGDCP